MATIFTPQNPSPRNEVRDMSIAQIFSITTDGVQCTHYQIRIYRVSDNALLHDTTKLTLSPTLPNGVTLSHTIAGGTVTNTSTNSYKWTIQVWNGAETVTTREFQFFAKTTPVLTFTPPATLTSQSYNFTATLTQAQGDLVNTYIFELYTSTNELLESSGQIQNFNMSHIFEGFTNGDSLKVRLRGTTTGGQSFDSGYKSFNVVYSPPNVNITPSVFVDNETSLITVNKSKVIQVLGTSTGTISYVDNFIYTGNKGVNIANNLSKVDFPVDIPLNFTLTFKWKPDSPSFTGVILELGDGAYSVGYNVGRFYYRINGILIYADPIDLTGKTFYITLLPTKIRVRYI